MVPVVIESLVLGSAQAPSVLILRPEEEQGKRAGRMLPIWIGTAEAGSIGIALNGSRPSRPMTHDLFMMVLNTYKLKLDRVIISRATGSMFYADLVLTDGETSIGFDGRPSDCIALAVRMGAPIFVAEEVLESSSFPYVFGKSHHFETDLEDFRNFIENVSPEDFYRELESEPAFKGEAENAQADAQVAEATASTEATTPAKTFVAAEEKEVLEGSCTDEPSEQEDLGANPTFTPDDTKE